MTDPTQPSDPAQPAGATPSGESAPQWAPPPAAPTPPPAAPPPPPPPAASAAYPPPPPAPGQPAPGGFTQPDWNAAAANLRNFDPKSVSPLDFAIMGLGVLVFLLSFMSYYKYSVKFSGGGATFNFNSSGSISAWDAGFFGWFGALAALVAAGLLAVSLIAKIELPINIRQVVLIAAGVAAACIVLALLIVPGRTFSGFGVSVDKGHGWAYWLSLLLVLGQAGLAFRRSRETS